ncbi:hypothetical protein [Persicirhabdus sediminis]|uniref:Uncharacterized protein n=1 Tax=Persicirhabdus sediminis TaxID=454144 RepID=A0A8J7MBV2_9BACT|nr:hypothetical protein [Persicirhabdus sediminis]MBK1790242.1 hypothetical protein [Persicirhabdus sediminis]
MQSETKPKDWTNTSASLAPTLLGAAAGVAIGELVKNESRKPLALGLVCLGAVALMPSVVDTVVDLINGPNSRRGSRRTLRSIRDSGADAADLELLEADMDDELFIG